MHLDIDTIMKQLSVGHTKLFITTMASLLGPGRSASSPRHLPTGSGITLMSSPRTNFVPTSNLIDNKAGMLRVEVMGAKNLAPAILGSLLKWTPSYSNPYVVIKLHREEFKTTIKDKTLNPAWKEMGQLAVPLPTEQDLLQTSGNDVHKSRTNKKLGSTSKNNIRQEYHPCIPELLVQVYHHSDANDITGDDKLLGSVIVPILPCLLSSASTHRSWYSLVASDDTMNSMDAGQIQLAMHYDVGGLEPQKGDLIRLSGFGGMDYYSKLLCLNARLEVIETFQDQIFAQCKSMEGWMLSFEFHRNLVHVVRRPSILRDASTQLQGQITRVRHSPFMIQANSIWLAVPESQRRHLLRLYTLALFTGGVAANVLTECVQKASTHGFVAALQTCRESGGVAMEKITTEFMEQYWTDPAMQSVDEQMEHHLRGGPLRGRGRIVRGFEGEMEEKYEEEPSEQIIVEEEPVDEEDEEVKTEKEAQTHQKIPTRVNEPIDNCPDQLICPITGCPMLDPVVAADGHTYEREAILHWFATSNISPMTGMHIPTTQVFPNFTLRKLSEEFQQSYEQKARR